MTDKQPSALGVAIFEILMDDDDVDLSEEFDHAWGQAMFFIDPNRSHPETPHKLIGMSAAVDIMLEASKAISETCDAVRKLIEHTQRMGFAD